jgi:hypothetical protein
MTHTDGRVIGRLLDASVPPLPEPPDRLAGIRRHVRRQRRGIAAMAAAAVVIVVLGSWSLLVPLRPPGIGVAGPSASAGPTEPVGPTEPIGPTEPVGPSRPAGPGAGACPSSLPRFDLTNGGLPTSGPGVLAPEGATRAVMCEFPWRLAGGVRRELILTRDVAGLVTVLNGLPAEPGIDPCFSIGGGGYLTLTYPDGARHTIELAGRCGFVRRGAITRHAGWDAVRAFHERYREQELAAADPGAVSAADCPRRLTADPANRKILPEQVLDTWLRSDGARYLAGPAAAVTACRYQRDDAGFRRTAQVARRSVAARADAALQTVFTTYPMRLPYFDCGPVEAITTVDVLVIRDSVGQTVEVRLPRDACPIVSFGEEGGRTPNEDLTDLLDELLGPV